ncbi:galactosylceramide sulfotransferase-like [Clavelina lepadiformis]|uniref:galactosylceramide sulfotransferase-like n=1 Tax=Clavelina lepadiformis TaxID=159417 RepID=UPI0040436955
MVKQWNLVHSRCRLPWIALIATILFFIKFFKSNGATIGEIKEFETRYKANEEKSFISQRNQSELSKNGDSNITPHFSTHKKISSCRSLPDIAYIKTHKTDSSTLRIILASLARKRSLPVATSSIPTYFGGYPGHMNEEFFFKRSGEDLVPVTPGDHFVIVDHCRLNATLLRELMNKNTVLISILRQPWYQFQSSFYYYYTSFRSRRPNMKISCFPYPYIEIAKGKDYSLLEYLNLAYENLNDSIPWFFRSKNYQAFDLGLDPMLDDDGEIKIQVQRLSSQIDFMMIMEYREESLILLKELLCMDWSDLLKFGPGHTSYTSIDVEAYPQMLKKFKKMYKLDIALYEHFNATFWRRVEQYGRGRMYDDVITLRNKRDEKRAENDSRKLLEISPVTLGRRKRSIDIHQEIYASVPKTLSKEYKLSVLRSKIERNSRGLTNRQISRLANYMTDNHGWCPL